MTEVPKPHDLSPKKIQKENLSLTDLSTLMPGDVIELADIKELAELEDLIVQTIKPNYDRELWNTRTKLQDLIKPKGFHGRITNIKLIVMDDPYEKLITAHRLLTDYSHRTHPGSDHKLTSDLAESLKTKYMGFSLIAEPKSSRPGNLGQLQAELWYFPVPPALIKEGKSYNSYYTTSTGEVRQYTYTSKTASISNRNTAYGKVIHRVLTTPKIERQRFIELQKESRRVAFNSLKKTMRNPFSIPMGGKPPKHW